MIDAGNDRAVRLMALTDVVNMKFSKFTVDIW
jgi:hypothetical protein